MRLHYYERSDQTPHRSNPLIMIPCTHLVVFFFDKRRICLNFTGVSLFRVKGSCLDSSNFSYKFKHTFYLRVSPRPSKVRKFPFVFSLFVKIYGGNHSLRCVISLAF